ncbi:MFS transporter [Candidatus Woesebacteria bacterium]|nr:MFS transporter [Candidatus Woesebacteria bacterium]
MLKEFKPILTNRSFLYLWTSQIFSQITINILNFMLLIRIFTETGSTIAVSLFWVAYALAAILVGPFAAVTVDIFERRRVLMTASLIEAITIFLYSLVHQTRFFTLYLIVFSYSFLNQFYVPAEQASLPSLVPKTNLAQANSLFFLTQQAALAIGFGLGSLLLETLGFSNALVLCSFLLLIAFFSNSFLPKMPVAEFLPASFEESLKTFFTQIGEGYYYIKSHRSVLFPFSILLGMQVALAVAAINAPVLAKEVLKINVSSVGKSVVVPGAIGAGLGGLIVARALKSGWRKKKVIETSFLALSLSTAFLMIFVPLMPGLSRTVFSTVDFFVIGLSFVGILIPTLTFLQEVTPSDFRGRVFGNYWFLVTLVTIIPVIFTAAVSEFLGVKTLFLGIALILFIVFILSKKYGEELVVERL